MVHSVVEELAGLKQGFTDIIPPHVLAGISFRIWVVGVRIRTVSVFKRDWAFN